MAEPISNNHRECVVTVVLNGESVHSVAVFDPDAIVSQTRLSLAVGVVATQGSALLLVERPKVPVLSI
ncbi:hypothetical protein G6M86_27760 (plasmid) [Agrobacterium tumefaciens]|uniref:Uncharacterized protein n=1 Tax=Agrobacterium tumefaciens TaxID=358 RepID=A0AAJ4N8E0_AGRTU|nr:hypothetical protein G6M86_27760 [Agrobacterium tumefaciens]